jgi:hypothetical protein
MLQRVPSQCSVSVPATPAAAWNPLLWKSLGISVQAVPSQCQASAVAP